MASIVHEAVLLTDKLDKAILESKRKIKDWSKDIEKSTEGIDGKINKTSDSFNKQGTVVEKVMRREKGLIEDIRNTIRQYEEAKERAWKVEDIEKYNKKIAEAKQHLKEYEQAGVDASKETENFNTKISKWVLSLGGAAAALGLLKKAFQETTVGVNAFNIAGAVTKQVLYDIVSGAGLSISSLRSAIEIQREANDLRVKEYKDSYEAAKLNNEFQQLWSDSLDATLSGMEKVKTIDAALAAHNEEINIRIKNAQEHLALAEKSFLIRPGSEKLRKEISDLNIQLENLDAERVSSTKRLVRQRSILIKEETEKERQYWTDLHNDLTKLADEYLATQNKNAEKLRDLNNEIEAGKIKGQDKELLQLEQKYDKDLEAYKDNEAIKTALAAKYAQDRYEIEIKYLDQIKNENRKIVETLLKLDPGRGSAILGRALTKGKSPLKPTIQTAGDIDKQKEANLQKELDLRKKIIANAIVFTDELATQLGLTQEQTEAIGLMTKTVMQLAEGNYIGAALGILAKIIGVFGQMGDVISEPKWKKQIEAWDALIERQKRVIELSELTGGTELALNKAVLDAQKKLDDINTAIAQARTRRGDRSEIQDLLDAHREAVDELYDAQQALNKFITGGINQIDIADMLSQGFEDGKKSAKDFADDFDSLMRNAINNSLEGLSKPSITAWYTKFAADMASAGGLDAEEIVTLKNQWNTIIAAEEERRKQVYAIAGITDNAVANVGLTGQIRRDLTEETGTELVALFRRYADEQRVVKDYSIRGVAHLVGIESNTAATVSQLQLAVSELQSININTKQVAVGGLG